MGKVNLGHYLYIAESHSIASFCVSDFNVLGSLHHTFANKGTQSFSVEIVDDSEIEEEETFSLSLVKAYPSDAVQFDPAILNVTIMDNDSKVYSIDYERLGTDS